MRWKRPKEEEPTGPKEPRPLFGDRFINTIRCIDCAYLAGSDRTPPPGGSSQRKRATATRSGTREGGGTSFRPLPNYAPRARSTNERHRSE